MYLNVISSTCKSAPDFIACDITFLDWMNRFLGRKRDKVVAKKNTKMVFLDIFYFQPSPYK